VIEELFSNAVILFIALGTYIYGDNSPKVVYPELQTFVRKANTNTVESFSNHLKYINWVSNNLFIILEDKH